MENEYITITEFCTSHNIESDFIMALADEGLIHVTIIESSRNISMDQLSDLEMYTRWKYQMGIGPEAIDVIRNLLQRMKEMRHEIDHLKSRLSLYE